MKTKAAIKGGDYDSHFFDGCFAGMITFEWINQVCPAGRDRLTDRPRSLSGERVRVAGSERTSATDSALL